MSATQRWDRISPPGLPEQRDDELVDELLKRDRPWTMTEYEHVRQAALAMSRTHVTVDRMGQKLSCFDGQAYWDLLGALDRSNS